MNETNAQLTEGTADIFGGDDGHAEEIRAAAVAGRKAARRRADRLRANLVLAGLLAGGLATVYLLSLRGGPAEASAEQTQVELQVDTVMTHLQSMEGETTNMRSREILATFYCDPRERQVPLSELSTNPFAFKAPELRPTPTPLIALRPKPTLPEDAGLEAAEKAVRELTLQSVLTGADGQAVAMINGNLLAKGQTVAGWKIERISPREVLLKWRDRTHVLTMED